MLDLDNLERLLAEAGATRDSDSLAVWVLEHAPRLLALARAGERLAEAVQTHFAYSGYMEAPGIGDALGAWKEAWGGAEDGT